MQFESPRISARLEHIASKMSCGPDILDWLSGLVVPLLLGALTLAVAIWAGRIAKAANDQSKLLYEQSANETARRLRIPYATELSLMTEGVLNARTHGQDPQEIILDLARLDRLRGIQAASDEATSRELLRWALLLSRLAAPNESGYWSLRRRVSTGIDAWIEDPGRAQAIFTADDAELQLLVQSAPGSNL